MQKTVSLTMSNGSFISIKLARNDFNLFYFILFFFAVGFYQIIIKLSRTFLCFVSNEDLRAEIYIDDK